MSTRLAGLVPGFLGATLRGGLDRTLDLLDRLRGQDPMIPPRSISFVGRGKFVEVGRIFRGYFIELGGLRPDHRVLDVGCGIGRMAIPLTEYLSADGEYHGFDVVREGIAWCQRRITPRHPNFHFQHSDVYNRHYNPTGRARAADFRFPFADGAFDFVFLTSVFTHMLPADLARYLGEIARVLRPGGRCLVTFFLLNEESRALVAAGRSSLPFRHEVEGGLTTTPGDPETALAHDEVGVRALFAGYGLRVEPPIHYGSWCGRSRFVTYQDMVVARKAAEDREPGAVAAGPG